MRSDRHQQRHHSAPGRQSTLLLVGLHQNDLSDWKFASTEVPKIIPVRTSRNFFRLGLAFLDGEIAKPKKVARSTNSIVTGYCCVLISPRDLTPETRAMTVENDCAVIYRKD